jgi:hypothetical protein
VPRRRAEHGAGAGDVQLTQAITAPRLAKTAALGYVVGLNISRKLLYGES